MKKYLYSLVLLTIAACSSNDSNETGIEGNNYNRTLLLTNWADNIIIPSYVNYQTKIEVLATNINTFNSVTTEVNLQAVRTSWIEAYKAYQYM
jgi:predicted lipoprotein